MLNIVVAVNGHIYQLLR